MVMFENAMTEEATLADVERSIEPVVQGFLRRISIPALSEKQKEQATGYLQELAERHPDQSSYLSRQIGMLGMYGGRYGAVPSFAQSVRSHVYAEDWPADGGAFEDVQIERMLAALDAMLALPETVEDFEREAGYVFRDFTARLRRGQISDEQTARIFVHIDAFQAEHPELAEVMDERRHYIEYLIPGRVARGETPSYRTWWDGHSQPDADPVAADGPIANAWNVRGWPTIFILDPEGVIRHIDKRGGDLISTLDDMLMEVRMRAHEAERAAATQPETDS